MKNLIKILEESEKSIPNILNEVESEYKMGGLSIGLYADYATDVSKRHNRQTILKLVEGLEKWAKNRCTDNIKTFGTDKWNGDLEELISLLKPLQDKLK